MGEVVIKQIIVQEGENPFSYASTRIIAENERSKLEIVQDTSGRRLLRKTKKVKNDGDLDFMKLQELQKREADFLMETDHPAFPKGYGYFNGSVEGMGWVTSFVRDYVPGESLEDVVKKGGVLDVGTAADYGRQIAEGLKYVHQKEFLFRDVKPSNMILEEGTKSQATPYGRIKLTDLDALGRTQQVQGIGGSTFGVGTAGWTHPLQMVPGMASVQTDLFGVGTLLYYCVMGKQAAFKIDKEGGVTFDHDDMQLLAEKLNEEQGGPELVKIISNLVSPKETKQYQKSADVIADLQKVCLISKEGYNALENDSFVVNRKSWYANTKERAQEFLTPFLQGAYEIISHPIGTGISLALIAGLAVGTGTSHYLQKQSAERAVFFAPEISGEANPIMEGAVDINNLANGVGALYVRMNGSDTPNDVFILQETKRLIALADTTSETVEAMKGVVQPLANPISHIRSAGTQIRSSFQHSSVDNYITVIDLVPVTSCDANNNCTTTNVTVPRQQYTDTDHYWKLNKKALQDGAVTLASGTAEMEAMNLTNISVKEYLKVDVPQNDAVGRPVVDKEAYQRGENEWISKGPVPSYNRLVHLGSVTDNTDVKQLYADIQAKLSSGYPENSHENNICSSCDEQGAPAGYIVSKHVHAVAKTYVENYEQLDNILVVAPSKITLVKVALEDIANTLEKGKKVSASDFNAAADRATELYKLMVPDSEIAAPTSNERMWYPIGFGVGAALVMGIGSALLRQMFISRQYARQYYY